MLKAMIVDDEPLMLKYLGSSLHSLSTDWVVEALAADGLEAVALLEKQHYDLVITDIKMPRFDGLQLSSYIYENYPDTKIVIISGFDDFDYARQAIRCGVSDYLLKPLQDEKISEILKRLSKEINNKKTAQVQLSLLSSVSLEDNKIIEHLLKSITLYDNSSVTTLCEEVIKRKLLPMSLSMGIVILRPDYGFLVCQNSSYSDCQKSISSLYKALMENYHSWYKAVCIDSFNNICLLLTAENEQILHKKCTMFCNTVRDYAKAMLGLVLEGSCSFTCNDIYQLSKGYSTAKDSLDLYQFDHTYPKYLDSSSKSNQQLKELRSIEHSIYMDYISANENSLMADLSNYFNPTTSNADINQYRKLLLHIVFHICQQSKLKEEQLERSWDYIHTTIERISSNDKESLIKKAFKAIMYLKDDGDIRIGEGELIANRAREYICSNYSAPLSLTIVADSIGVSPGYLSDIFHKTMGESFSKFVTRIRMEQAVKLLKGNQNTKIYSVAEATGYINAKHFISVFKKYYGVTPKEFMNQKLK